MIFFNKCATGMLMFAASSACALILFLSSYSALLKIFGLFTLLSSCIIAPIALGSWQPRNNFSLYLVLFVAIFLGFAGYKILTIPSLRKVAAMPLSLVRMQCAINNAGYENLPSNTELLMAYKKLMVYDFLDNLFPQQQAIHKPLKHAHLLSREFYYYDHDNLLLLLHEIFAAKNYGFTTTNPAPFIIDCGSNIGASIVFFKMLYPHASVLGFEAGPDAFAALKKTVETNALSHVQINNKAVFNHNGTLHFPASNIQAGNPSASFITPSDDHTKFTVAIPCVKLSDYIDRDVDMLKVDIEGAESEVFEDLAQHNKLHHIKQMIVEFHNMAKDTTRPSLATFLQLLDAHGFAYIIHSPIRTPFNINDEYPILVYATKK